MSGISSILQLVSHVKIDDVSKRKINQVLEEKFKVSQMDTIEINKILETMGFPENYKEIVRI